MYAKVIEQVNEGCLNYVIQVQRAYESILTAKQVQDSVVVKLEGSNHNSLGYLQGICEKINNKQIIGGTMNIPYDEDNEKFKRDDEGNEIFIETDNCHNCNTEIFVGMEEFCLGCGRPIMPNYNEDDPREDR